MPEFKIEGSNKRITVQALTVSAVSELDDNLSAILLTNGVQYEVTTNYDTTVKTLKGERV